MKKYDVIVLGSGSASSKIISRSSNAGKSIAVIEADKLAEISGTGGLGFD